MNIRYENTEVPYTRTLEIQWTWGVLAHSVPLSPSFCNSISGFPWRTAPPYLSIPVDWAPLVLAVYTWPGLANERQAMVIGVRMGTWHKTGQWNSTLGHSLDPFPLRSLSWRMSICHHWGEWQESAGVSLTQRKVEPRNEEKVSWWHCWAPVLSPAGSQIPWTFYLCDQINEWLRLSELDFCHWFPWPIEGTLITPMQHLELVLPWGLQHQCRAGWGTAL